MSGYFDLPTRPGYMVRWYTGEVRNRTRKMRDGSRKVIGQIRWEDTYINSSREKVEAKAKELEQDGIEVIGIYECCY